MLSSVEQCCVVNVLFSLVQKSYKYGCGLIAAAEKGRRSFQLDATSASSLLSSHTSSWETLLSEATEVADRLKIARYFHSLCEEVGVASIDSGCDDGPLTSEK